MGFKWQWESGWGHHDGWRGGPGHSTTRGQWGRRNEETRRWSAVNTQTVLRIYFYAGNDRYYSPDMSSWENLRCDGTRWHVAHCHELRLTLSSSPACDAVTLICPDCDEIDGAMCPLSRWHAGTGRGAAPHLAGEAATKERGETWLRECKSGHQAVNTRGGSRGNTTEGDKVNISLNYEPE